MRSSAANRLYPSEIIFRQGEPATSLILVVSGLVKIWRTAEHGTPITLALLGPGQPIGTLHAARQMPNTANVSAHVRTEIIVRPLPALRRIMAGDPALSAKASNIVARYAVRMIERLEEMATAPVEQRVARLLCRASDIAPSPYGPYRSAALTPGYGRRKRHHFAFGQPDHGAVAGREARRRPSPAYPSAGYCPP